MVSFVVSAIIVFLILLIPVGLNYDFKSDEKIIELTLSKEIKPSTLIPVVQPQEIEKVVDKPLLTPQTEQVIESKKPVEKEVEKIVEKPPILVEPKVIERDKSPTAEPTTKLPSSTAIFKSAYGKVKLYELDEAFKARTGDEEDFKFKKIEQPEWNTVTKLIDEELDKPRVYMDFYSPGIVGATEKFFDKISYKKVFTTRYGTKIACGGVGPLVACSWK